MLFSYLIDSLSLWLWVGRVVILRQPQSAITGDGNVSFMGGDTALFYSTGSTVINHGISHAQDNES